MATNRVRGSCRMYYAHDTIKNNTLLHTNDMQKFRVCSNRSITQRLSPANNGEHTRGTLPVAVCAL